jgi:hypothetical protein
VSSDRSETGPRARGAVEEPETEDPRLISTPFNRLSEDCRPCPCDDRGCD